MARLILHQGETFLSSQLQVATASDMRALTAASVLTAIGTAVIAATLVYWSEEKNLQLLLAGIACGVVTIIGAFFALWAARPIEFYFPGNHPKEWWDCRTCDLPRAIGGESENYQIRIESNERCLAKNGFALIIGAAIAATAPLIGLIVWLLLTWIS